MASIEFSEYKVKLNDLESKLEALKESLGLEKAREQLERLHAMAESDGFWNDTANSQKVTKQIRQLETKIESYEKMCSDREDMLVLCEMAEEEDDDSMLTELWRAMPLWKRPWRAHGLRPCFPGNMTATMPS